MSQKFEHQLRFRISESSKGSSASTEQHSANIIFTCEEYFLNLRSAFGTSHSITTSRTNILFSLAIKSENESLSSGEKIGYGEVGLPPKKPLCYLADVADIKSYFQDFNQYLEKESQNPNSFQYNPFSSLPEQYFAFLRNNKAPILQIFNFLFYCLDTCPANEKEYSKAARSGLEALYFDLLGKLFIKPIYELIGIPKPFHPSFFTAALNPSIDAIVESVQFSLQYTHFLKIKLDGNFERSLQILNTLYSHFGKQSTGKWSIDANAAWTPEITKQFIEILSKEPFKNLVFMIEQPFPVELGKKDDVPESEKNAWKEIKQLAQANSFLIFADESFSSYKDIEKLKPFVHGVNMKLEKAGGIRDGLKSLYLAKQEGLNTWVGSMVGSCLNSSTAVHLLPLTDYGGDLDGGLLTDEKSQKFSGGFSWIAKPTDQSSSIGMATFEANLVGIGCILKKE